MIDFVKGAAYMALYLLALAGVVAVLCFVGEGVKYVIKDCVREVFREEVQLLIQYQKEGTQK